MFVPRISENYGVKAEGIIHVGLYHKGSGVINSGAGCFCRWRLGTFIFVQIKSVNDIPGGTFHITD